MDRNIIDRLLGIAAAGLMVAGLIFLAVMLFEGTRGTWTVAAALVCILLSNIFRMIRRR